MQKLTDSQKDEIEEKYLTGNYNCAELGREYNLTKETINQMLRKRNVTIFNDLTEINRKYLTNNNYFDIIDTQEKAYFLGLLYADGYNNEKKSSVAISLTGDDKEILEKFNISLESNRPIAFRDRKSINQNWKDEYKISIYSKHMSQQLAKLGCVQAKSLILEFPTEEQVPSHLLQHFIRGYFDGDGCISCSKRNERSKINIQCNFVSTLNFCISLSDFLKQACNCYFYVTKPRKDKNPITRQAMTNGNHQSIRFLDWLYKDATIYLERKYNRYKEYSSLVNE